METQTQPVAVAEGSWTPVSVLETIPEGISHTAIRLIPEIEGKSFSFRPGQYIKVWFEGEEKPGYYAISSEPEEKGFIEILVKNRASLRPGDLLRVSEPMGKGYPIEQLKNKRLLLVGIGSGIAPLRSLMRSILRKNQDFGDVTLVYGARTVGDLPYTEEIEIWRRKVRVRLALSAETRDKWPGFVGRVTHLLPRLDFDPFETVVCMCGSKDMETEVREILQRVGFKAEDILVNY